LKIWSYEMRGTIRIYPSSFSDPQYKYGEYKFSRINFWLLFHNNPIFCFVIIKPW
jgi:hypothetical protein